MRSSPLESDGGLPSGENRPTLSALVLTKNEARRIERCLRSLEWADEIVIVDDESDDDTVEICRRYTGNVVIHRMEGFGAQRNLGIERARGDWILSLDADEVVPADLRDEILHSLRTAGDVTGFYVLNKIMFLGRWMRHGDWYGKVYPGHLRLFRRGSGCFTPGVHERLEHRGPTRVLRNATEHYTIESVSDYLAKMSRYTDLEAENLLQSGKLGSPIYGLVYRPLRRFVSLYVAKAGFLDGAHGLVLSVLTSFHLFLAYAKGWERKRARAEGADS